MSTMFTVHQREILKRRIARALCWAEVPVSYRDSATRLAIVVLDELEISGHSAAAQRRAVENIVKRLEEAS